MYLSKLDGIDCCSNEFYELFSGHGVIFIPKLAIVRLIYRQPEAFQICFYLLYASEVFAKICNKWMAQGDAR